MSYLCVRGRVERLPFADQSVDLVVGSPPYVDARLYLEGGKNLKIARRCAAWVDWMVAVTEESLRVSKGAVIWVAAGATRGRNYQPACEGLIWEWWKRGGHAYRPCYWHRVGIPGSGGDQWFRADVEHMICFKRRGKLPWADNTATGRPPKFKPGGTISHRLPDGVRANLKKRAENGAVLVKVSRRGIGQDTRPENEFYIPPEIANPGNLIHTNAGGGHTGPQVALDGNEAPYAEEVPDFWVRSLCPPGGLVLDPFGGSGTTASVAVRNGRRAVTLDLRQSQCELAARRVAADQRPVSRLDAKAVKPADGQMSLF